MIRHEHGQKFALEAEVEIESAKDFLPRLGLRLRLTIQGSKGIESRLRKRKRKVSCELRLKLLSNSSRGQG